MLSMRAALKSAVSSLVFAAAASGAASLPGCGSDQQTTGTQVTAPPEQIQANKNMEDFMKKGGGGTPAETPKK